MRFSKAMASRWPRPSGPEALGLQSPGGRMECRAGPAWHHHLPALMNCPGRLLLRGPELHLSLLWHGRGASPSGTQDRQMACPRSACLERDTDRHHISSLCCPSVWVGAGALNPARSSVLSASHGRTLMSLASHISRETLDLGKQRCRWKAAA